ncbi:precorrin-8X methylmutase [Treponema ruminis]|uniref:Precorrin-8X/cobalt-precorrin-8 methylmutase n=1 Tax=Treponema ruminis TaxID=744515 RepID=A0A7W8GB28_9SPIR|nr:precorrin-8X methylmutase [Treponema ruminis]MBB5227169.1 precorrin-8X/cobalt-precorrin-8 methylmutase [Treponema ruminis]
MIQLEHVLPADIEKTSFSIIASELAEKGISLPEELAPIIMRVIHTTADFEYAKTLKFSPNVVEIIKKAIKSGADIVTDTNMALAGINKKSLEKFGGQAHCFMADEEVAKKAKELNQTRATVSMKKASQIEKSVIFAIGNAPTALVELCSLMEIGFRPVAVIGVPVGFVNVVAAKEMIMASGVPYIVNEGRKGGSTVAAAICNAILYSLK